MIEEIFAGTGVSGLLSTGFILTNDIYECQLHFFRLSFLFFSFFWCGYENVSYTLLNAVQFVTKYFVTMIDSSANSTFFPPVF